MIIDDLLETIRAYGESIGLTDTQVACTAYAVLTITLGRYVDEAYSLITAVEFDFTLQEALDTKSSQVIAACKEALDTVKP